MSLDNSLHSLYYFFSCSFIYNFYFFQFSFYICYMVVWHICIIITSTIFLVLCNQRFVQIHENFLLLYFSQRRTNNNTHTNGFSWACQWCLLSLLYSSRLGSSRLLRRRHVHNIALLNISAYAHIHMYIYIYAIYAIYAIYICICVSVYSMCR